MTALVQAHPFNNLHNVSSVVTPGLPAYMDGDGPRLVESAEAFVPRPQAKISLLRVQKIRLVPPAQRFVTFPRHEQGCPERPVHDAGAGIGRWLRDVRGQRRQPGPAEAEGPQQGRLTPQ